MYFTKASNITVGDSIFIRDIEYPVLWTNVDEYGTVMIGIADTPFVSSNFASFKANDMIRVDHPNCNYCQLHKGGMMPSHYASSMCKSGKRNHCTCDTCF